MDKIKSKLKNLEEIVSQLNDSIYPSVDHFKRLRWLTRKNLFTLMDKHPKCLIVKDIGRRLLFPICNRQGIHDREVIDFSMKYAKVLSKRYADPVSRKELEDVLSQLMSIRDRLNGEMEVSENTDTLMKKIELYMNQLQKKTVGTI